MENKVILVAAIWLSGFIVGLILIARWLRMGERELATPTPAPMVEEPPPTPSTNRVQRAARRLTGPIVTGAKTDLLRVRRVTMKVTHRVPRTVGVSEPATMN